MPKRHRDFLRLAADGRYVYFGEAGINIDNTTVNQTIIFFQRPRNTRKNYDHHEDPGGRPRSG
jgi:hypothetical protein